MMKRDLLPPGPLAACLAAVLMIVVGCGEGRSPNAASNKPTPSASAELPADLLLTSAPDGAQPITSLKRSAKEGDEVVVRVVVGGRVDPMVKGRASASIIDASLSNPCLAEDDHCATPWDYCCSAPEDLTANLAALQVVDEGGRVLVADLPDRIKPLSTLTVRGVVGPRPDQQILTINATGIYVEPVAQ